MGKRGNGPAPTTDNERDLYYHYSACSRACSNDIGVFLKAILQSIANATVADVSSSLWLRACNRASSQRVMLGVIDATPKLTNYSWRQCYRSMHILS